MRWVAGCGGCVSSMGCGVHVEVGVGLWGLEVVCIDAWVTPTCLCSYVCVRMLKGGVVAGGVGAWLRVLFVGAVGQNGMQARGDRQDTWSTPGGPPWLRWQGKVSCDKVSCAS